MTAKTDTVAPRMTQRAVCAFCPRFLWWPQHAGAFLHRSRVRQVMGTVMDAPALTVRVYTACLLLARHVGYRPEAPVLRNRFWSTVQEEG
jgi:hypothetical protein